MSLTQSQSVIATAIDALHGVDSTISISTASCIVLGTATGRKVERIFGSNDIFVSPVDPNSVAYIINLSAAPIPDVTYDHFYDTTLAEYTAQVAVFPVRAVKGVRVVGVTPAQR